MTLLPAVVELPEDSLSLQLQRGKAGEHLVCADLIMQGFNAFLADQGLPFDVVVDTPAGLRKVQVKSTQGLKSCGKSLDVFRFNMKSGKGSTHRVRDADVFAFVALDTRQIAYMQVAALQSQQGGGVVTLVELRTRAREYKGRTYSNGTVRDRYGRFIEDFKEFKSCL